MRPIILLSILFNIALLAGCGSPSRAVLAQDGLAPAIDWTPEERSRLMASRTLRTTEHASHHIVLLSGAEQPHVHDRTDLTLFVLRGRIRMHLGSRSEIARPGDVIDIPRGVPHWAENLASDGSEAYMIASPPRDGSDTRPYETAGPADTASPH